MYGKIRTASAFTSIFYHKGYEGIRYMEVYKMAEREIHKVQMEMAEKLRDHKRLESEAEEERKEVKREYMREYRRKRKLLGK